MKLPIDKERFKIYMKIGAVYLGLSMFGELVENPADISTRLLEQPLARLLCCGGQLYPFRAQRSLCQV